MSTRLYQLNAQDWSPEAFRYKIWEGKPWHWRYGKKLAELLRAMMTKPQLEQQCPQWFRECAWATVFAMVECICQTRRTTMRTAVPIFARISVKKVEFRTLATLNNTLLPKLLSGKLQEPRKEALTHG